MSFTPCRKNKSAPSNTFLSPQGNRPGFPGSGGQPGCSVHNEGVSVCQSLRQGGGPVGAAAVSCDGSHRDDPCCAASLDLSGGIVIKYSYILIRTVCGRFFYKCRIFLCVCRTFLQERISGNSCLTNAKSLKLLVTVGRS